MVVMNICYINYFCDFVFNLLKFTFIFIQKRRHTVKTNVFPYTLERTVTTYMSFTGRYLSSQDH